MWRGREKKEGGGRRKSWRRGMNRGGTKDDGRRKEEENRVGGRSLRKGEKKKSEGMRKGWRREEGQISMRNWMEGVSRLKTTIVTTTTFKLIHQLFTRINQPDHSDNLYFQNPNDPHVSKKSTDVNESFTKKQSSSKYPKHVCSVTATCWLWPWWLLVNCIYFPTDSF